MYNIENQTYLYLLIAVPILLFVFLIYMNWKKRTIKNFGDEVVVKKLIKGFSKNRLWLKMFMLLLAISFIIIGLSNPQTGSKLEKAEREGIDIMIALDVSNSMMAEDIQPNRLERAKQAISKLVDKLTNDRIGMIVFAGKAFTQLPITTDYSAAKLFLSTITTDMIPVQGTAITDAINLAVDSFVENDHSKAIILITDGENHEGDAIEAAKKAAEKGIYIFAIGMGKSEGVPIPLYKGKRKSGYRKDRNGNIVISKLNENMLRQIASAGNGSYISANNTQVGLRFVFKEINKLDKTKFETKMFADYKDKFQIFLVIGLVLLVLEFLLFERKERSFF